MEAANLALSKVLKKCAHQPLFTHRHEININPLIFILERIIQIIIIQKQYTKIHFWELHLYNIYLASCLCLFIVGFSQIIYILPSLLPVMRPLMALVFPFGRFFSTIRDEWSVQSLHFLQLFNTFFRLIFKWGVYPMLHHFICLWAFHVSIYLVSHANFFPLL